MKNAAKPGVSRHSHGEAHGGQSPCGVQATKVIGRGGCSIMTRQQTIAEIVAEGLIMAGEEQIAELMSATPSADDPAYPKWLETLLGWEKWLEDIKQKNGFSAATRH